jgi:hypothetical protein
MGEQADINRRSAIALARHIVAIRHPDILPAHLRRALDAAIWAYTKADGKYSTRYRSVGALGEMNRRRLTHEHVVTRKLLVDRMLAEPQRVGEILATAVACVVTREEHRRLSEATRADPSLEGWDRYAAAGIEVVDTWA